MIEAGHQWEGGDDPVEDVARREQERHMSAAFSQLSEEHQAVLVLRVVEGLAYNEIADALGIPPGTVMSRLYTARRQIADALETEQ